MPNDDIVPAKVSHESGGSVEPVKVHVMSCVVCDDCGIVAAGIDAAEAMMSALRHDKRHTKGDLAHVPTDGRLDSASAASRGHVHSWAGPEGTA